MSSDHEPFTIVDAEVDGARVDVAVDDRRVSAVAPDLPRLGRRVIDAGGAALLPGLHDHHVHLLAAAAALRSVDVGGAADGAAFDRALADAHRRQPAGERLRVVGYDESHGGLTAVRLAALAPGRDVRVQHRSGAAWFVDGAWAHRADETLRDRWPDEPPPDLAPVGARLAALGITGVTDATPSEDLGSFALLARARADGALPQRVAVTGGAALATANVPGGLERGPVKIVVADHALPSPDALADAVRAAHAAGRPVAVHCVTRVALVLALTAWETVGAVAGDRIEHGAVIPLELVGTIAELGLQVVTQPAFVHARGDRYLAEVEPDDVPHLYRCGSLLDAGVGVGGSTDAPFGPDDPWLAIATAADRRTRTGQVVGAEEAIAARIALDRFLSPLDDPGGPPRRVVPGAPADLCLLASPLAPVLAAPADARVRATWTAGTHVPAHVH